MRPAAAAHLKNVEAVLDSLRRGQRQLARNPRRALDTAVKQLLSLNTQRTSLPPTTSEQTYRIDDLARASNVTTRNIRAYQQRGLLHAATRVGRTAIFNDTHLTRLRMISSMLERGYGTTHILEMLSAWEDGKDIADVLGLERALLPPVAEDQPETVTRAAALELAGGAEDLALLIDAGLIEVTGSRARLLRPALLHAFEEMRSYGMTNTALVQVHLAVVPEVDKITSILVSAGARHMAPELAAQAATTADPTALVAMLTRSRALALASVTATLSSSLEHTIEELLTAYLAEVTGIAPTAHEA